MFSTNQEICAAGSIDKFLLKISPIFPKLKPILQNINKC